MNFGNIVIMMSKFGTKSGDFAQRGEISVSIGQSPNYLRHEVDQYILSKFPQYNNSTYLIKVNY